MTRNSLTVWLAGTVLVLAASTASGHHSQSAEFDRSRTIEFTGTVKTGGWTNPHGYVQVEVEGPDGAVVYKVEISAPNGLYRDGWRRTSVEPGTVVTFSGSPSRSPESMNVSGEMTLPDGTVAYRGAGPQAN